MATADQRHWSTFTGDENSIVISRPEPPSTSWWICLDRDFKARHDRELHRITGSMMARTVNPMLLGGKLP